MTELEKRKKLLVAESDVCRELLRLQIHNLKIGVIRTRQRFSPFNVPLLFMALPMAGSLFTRKRRRFTWRRLWALGFVGWQIYRRARTLSRAVSGDILQGHKTAAQEYLEKRI